MAGVKAEWAQACPNPFDCDMTPRVIMAKHDKNKILFIRQKNIIVIATHARYMEVGKQKLFAANFQGTRSRLHGIIANMHENDAA